MRVESEKVNVFTRKKRMRKLVWRYRKYSLFMAHKLSIFGLNDEIFLETCKLFSRHTLAR